MPPLQPLWERFVTHKLDSSYTRTPVKYSTSGGYSVGKGTSNDSRSWRIATAQTASDHALCPTQPDRFLGTANSIEGRFGEETV